MPTPRDIRRLAFLALFTLDARPESDAEELADSVGQSAEDLATTFREQDVLKALSLAQAAYSNRRAADAAVRELAPSWPSHRQPAVDRAILRLAHHEMSSGLVPPKVVIAEAVKLAKAYSTDRSPAFVNGVLDKIMKALPTPQEASATEQATDPEEAGS